MVTAGFLAASCCLLVFTAGYRESLRQSGEDQAAFQVPLDVSVAASARIAAPLETIDGNRLREVAPGTVVRPIVTSRVTAFGGTPRALVLPLTGVDREALTEMHEFRSVTGASVTADTLAQRLGADRPPDPAAPVIPAGARRITLQAQGFDADITLGLWLSTADGRQQQVRLEGSGPELSAELPGGEARIVQGLEIAESEFRVTRREHAPVRVTWTIRSPPAGCASASRGSTGRPPAGTGRGGGAARRTWCPSRRPPTSPIGSATPGLC